MIFKVLATICKFPLLWSFLLTVLYFPNEIVARDIIVDAKNGIDQPLRIEAALALKSLAYSWRYAGDGDKIILKAGSYTFPKGIGVGPRDVFQRQVEIVGEGADSVFITDEIDIGLNSSQYYGVRNSGTFFVNIKISNMTLLDGVKIYGGKKILVDNCRILKKGDLVGSEENISKSAVLCRGGSDIVIQNCDVTDAGNGFCLTASDSRIQDNYIHYLTQDGIQLIGCRNVSVERNIIENLDDGIDDGVAIWNRHCDAIHLFMAGDSPDSTNQEIVIRGNQISRVESQCIQFNNYKMGGNHNRGILIENNVFGPARAPLINNAEPSDGLIFRGNTLVLTDGDINFTSRYRTLNCGNFRVRFSEQTTGLQVYNNILVGEALDLPGAIRCDHNLYLAHRVQQFGKIGLGKECLRSILPQFKNANALTGELRDDSVAIDRGTRLSPDGNQFENIYEHDVAGVLRDQRPDMGAWEVKRRSPVAEPFRVKISEAKIISWVDDFEDGNLRSDPWLENATTHGIEWVDPQDGYRVQNYGTDRDGNRLSEPSTVGFEPALIAGLNVNFDFRISFVVRATSSADGGGPVFLYGDSSNFYWLRLGVSTISLIQKKAGFTSVIAAFPKTGLGKNLSHGVSVSVIRDKAVMRCEILIDKRRLGIIALKDEGRSERQLGRQIGLLRESNIADHRLFYWNFRVDQISPSSANLN